MTNTITSTNKQIVQRLYKEVLVYWNLPVVDELVAPQFRSHDWPENSNTGPDAFRHYYSTVIRSVLPDARYEVDDIIAEGDKVVVRWRLLGTHMGRFNNIPPTGKVITLRGIAIYRLHGGQLIERWVVTDLHSLIAELKQSSLPNEMMTT
ncbi:MAG: ester cyclase [Chitinophagaceae bacterium]|nr:ester cyclase [Chitinophagaceae bacterium]